MSEMLERVAAALEQKFKDRVSATAGQPFEATGVTAPFPRPANHSLAGVSFDLSDDTEGGGAD